MNRTFKVVFSRARGTFVAVNETTRNNVKKTVKAVAAATVAALAVSTGAFAEDFSYEQSSDNKGYAFASAGVAKTFAAADTLSMSITGNNTRAYGLLATGEKASYTNLGTIKTNVATEDAASYWKVKGMMADAGGTAVNSGIITVTNAYGMTVGSSAGTAGSVNTIVNNGTITVSGSGTGMEVAPTGTSATTATAKAVGTNNGKITASGDDAIGILVSGDGGVITNAGTISADKYAVKVQVEDKKTADGNKMTFAKGSSTTGTVYVGEGVTGTSVVFEAGSALNGAVKVTNKSQRTTLTGTVNISGQTASVGSAIYFLDATDSSIALENSTFSGNTANGKYAYGGAVYSYAKSFAVTGTTFSGNKATASGVAGSEADGGALMIKGNAATVLTDVVFTNNSASVTVSDTKQSGIAYGGAIAVDYSAGVLTGVDRASDLKIVATKDLTYSGNTVNSNSEVTNYDTWGYHVPTAQAGGFLFLDRGTAVEFSVADGATLKIGEEGASGDTDSIASSIPNGPDAKNKAPNGGQHAAITKTGAGTLTVNGSLDKYYGTVAVRAGTMEVNSAWKVKNAVTVASGATLSLKNFSVVAAKDSGNQNVEGTEVGGSIAVSGNLRTSSDQIFTAALGDEGTVKDAKALVSAAVTFADGSSLTLTDAKYNLDYVKTASALINKDKKAKIVLTGTLVTESTGGDTEETPSVSVDDLDSIGGDTVLADVTVDTAGKALVIGTGSSSAGDGEAGRSDSLSIGSVDLGTASSVKVAGNDIVLTLTGSGEGKDVIASTSEETVTVALAEGATLQLGTEEASSGGTVNATVSLDSNSAVAVAGAGDFAVTEITGDGKVSVAGTGSLTVEKLSGAATVSVGNSDQAGTLTVKSIEGMTGTLFADPAFIDGGTVTDASQMAVTNVSSAITATVIAGQNSIVSIGADNAAAQTAYKQLLAQNSALTWATSSTTGITAALYVAKPIRIGTGKILADGSLTSVADATSSANSVNAGTLSLAANSALIVNQATADSSTAYIGGTLKATGSAVVGLYNAKTGSFTLATTVEGADYLSFVTDNPFVTAAVDASGTVTASLDASSGFSAVESLGVQALAVRASSVLAESVADRTAINEPLSDGLNLWASVQGERYEADGYKNGGSFKSDMGYGTFGGEVAFAGNMTAGAALQYGKGTSRSNVSSIKNEVDSWGVALFGTYTVTDAAKLVADINYVQSKNDITASQSALNQSVDAKLYSVGVAAQTSWEAGNFTFTPSVGVRYSRLETDAMAIGSVTIGKQKQNLFQVPLTLRIGMKSTESEGWQVTPAFKVSFVPTFGDKDISVLGSNLDVIDTAPVQGTFGLAAQKGNLSLNADLMMGGGKRGTSSVGGKVGLKYRF